MKILETLNGRYFASLPLNNTLQLILCKVVIYDKGGIIQKAGCRVYCVVPFFNHRILTALTMTNALIKSN